MNTLSPFRKNVCILRTPSDAYSAIYTLQSLALHLQDKYTSVNFPIYGGTYRMNTLFLTRILHDHQRVEGRIQQISDTELEVSLIGHPSDPETAIHELVEPLLEAFRGRHHKRTLHVEYA